VLGLQLFFVDSNKFLAPARVFSKTIVSDTIKPCRKPRFTAKAADVFVGTQEGFLGQIIRERDIGAGKLTQQTSHTRLVASNQLAERVLIVINKNSRDKVCIGQLHARRLR
jgi:hypothetical protein